MPRKKKVSDSEEDFVVYDKTVTPKARPTRAKTGAKPASVIELLNSTDSEEETPKGKPKQKPNEKKKSQPKKKAKKGSSEDYDIDGELQKANESSLEIESSSEGEIDAIDEKITRSKSVANSTKTDAPKKRAAAKKKTIDESSSETAGFGDSEDDYSESEKAVKKKSKKPVSPKKNSNEKKRTNNSVVDNASAITVVDVEKEGKEMSIGPIRTKMHSVNSVENATGAASTVVFVPDAVQATVPDSDVVNLIEKPEPAPIVIEEKPKRERKTLAAKTKGAESGRGSEKKAEEIEKSDGKKSTGEKGKTLPKNNEIAEVDESSKKRQLSDEKANMGTIVRESAKEIAIEPEPTEKPTKKKFYRVNSSGAAVVPLASLSKPIVIPRDPVPLNISKGGGDVVRRVGLSKKKNVKPLHPPVK